MRTTLRLLLLLVAFAGLFLAWGALALFLRTDLGAACAAGLVLGVTLLAVTVLSWRVGAALARLGLRLCGCDDEEE